MPEAQITHTAATSEPAAGANASARRRVNACVHCHHKKIRCDLDPTAYRPCSSCASLDIPCRRRQRKQYASRRDNPPASRQTSPTTVTAATAPATATAANTDNAGDAVNASTAINFATTAADAFPTPAMTAPSRTHKTSLSTPSAYDSMQLPSSVPASGYCNTELVTGSYDWERSVSASSAPSAENFTVGTSTSGREAPTTAPFFSGDPHGYGYVLNVCNGGNESSTQHHFIPSPATSTMDKADLAYAEAKGCFAVLDLAVREDLIHAYFHYVHPMLPIIDIGDFLDRYWGTGEPPSMLLLWSMFSVAASFVPEHTIRALQCEDRHELKKMLYGRAKCLYMLDYEQDSVVLIQSCLLLGYWYSNLQDRTQSWYWTGIAISTAQTIGLHRNPDAKRHNRLLSSENRRLWKNIWWCCVLRDRWLAYGTGRPLRIKSTDHDMPAPDGDCMLLPQTYPQHNQEKPLIPPELSKLQFLFLGMLRLAVVLGDIMESIYRMQPSQPPEKDVVSSLAQRLRSCLLETTPDASDTKWTEFFTMYAQIHVEVATIALYRPFTTELARSQTQHDSTLRSVADTSVRKAASQINALLDRMISADTLVYAGPTMVSLLIPAMTIHLHEVRSSDQFTKAWSHNRLDFCLLVLKHLERNYPAATLVHELFVHARDKNCIPFGISRDQAGAHQSVDVADDGSGQGSDKLNGSHCFPGSDPFHMPDLMLPTPSSQYLSSMNDLDEEALASCLADNGASSLFAMDMDSFFNIG